MPVTHTRTHARTHAHTHTHTHTHVHAPSINISSFVCRVDDSVTHIKINNTVSCTCKHTHTHTHACTRRVHALMQRTHHSVMRMCCVKPPSISSYRMVSLMLVTARSSRRSTLSWITLNKPQWLRPQEAL